MSWDTPGHPHIAGTYRLSVSIMPMGEELHAEAVVGIDLFHG